MEPLEIGLGGKIISLAALRLNTSLISSPDGKHINPRRSSSLSFGAIR